MTTVTLELRLFADWHAGSGAGRGRLVDSEPVKSRAGLPYLPGRTLRGLLREAVELAAESALPEVSESAAIDIFGKPSQQGDGRTGNDGKIRVSNATLPADLERWLSTEANAPQLAGTLFRTLSSTAINERSTAKGKTLRTLEVAVPLRLEAEITSVDAKDSSWREPLAASLPFLRGLGSNRRRGLGRVLVTVKAPQHQAADLS